MSALGPEQHPDWSNNIYFLIVTRVLMVIGLSYLLRSFFQLVQLSLLPSTRGAGTRPGTLLKSTEYFPNVADLCFNDGGPIDVDIELVDQDLVAGIISGLSGDIEMNQIVSITPPSPSYHPPQRQSHHDQTGPISPPSSSHHSPQRH